MVFSGLALLFMLLTFYDPLSDHLVTLLERNYPVYQVSKNSVAPSFIVVLGGGAVPDPNIPTTSQLNKASLVRLIEGVRLAQLYPEAKLILSGGSPYGGTAEAVIMQQLALQLKVPANRVIVEDRSLDTKDQAQIIKLLVKTDRFLLVTSALHMTRSMMLFVNKGMKPTPVPVGHLVRGKNSWFPGTIAPRSQILRNSDLLMHELYGILWAMIRGQG